MVEPNQDDLTVTTQKKSSLKAISGCLITCCGLKAYFSGVLELTVALKKQGFLLFFIIIIPLNPKRGIWNGILVCYKTETVQKSFTFLLEDCLVHHFNAATLAE